MRTEDHDNICDVLAAARPEEAKFVRAMLRAGRIDGGCYTTVNGAGQKCGCLLGSIYIKRAKPSKTKCDANDVSNLEIIDKLGMPLRVTGHQLPAERAFYPIRLGDTPDNASVAAECDDTITELMLSNPRYFGRVAK